MNSILIKKIIKIPKYTLIIIKELKYKILMTIKFLNYDFFMLFLKLKLERKKNMLEQL